MKRQLVVLMCFVSIVAARGFGSTDSPNLMELQSGWRMSSADNISVDDGLVSRPTLDVSKWYVVERMPATVLQILEDNGVYKDLYYGTNLATPKDLWKHDWWYRTTFTAPSGRDVYSLIFKTRDLAKANDFLKSKGLRPEAAGSDSIALGKDQAFGMVVGFTQRALPNDPR